MMCYKDKTFCHFDECLDFTTCHRALTDKVYAEAAIWWGKDYPPPICQYVDPPECYRVESE